MSVNNTSGLVMVENIVYFKPILSAYWAQSLKGCPKAHLSAICQSFSLYYIYTSLAPALVIPYLSTGGPPLVRSPLVLFPLVRILLP